MVDPIAASIYGRLRQQEIAREAKAYWQAQLARENRGQSSVFDSPHRLSPVRRAAYFVAALIR